MRLGLCPTRRSYLLRFGRREKQPTCEWGKSAVASARHVAVALWSMAIPAAGTELGIDSGCSPHSIAATLAHEQQLANHPIPVPQARPARSGVEAQASVRVYGSRLLIQYPCHAKADLRFDSVCDRVRIGDGAEIERQRTQTLAGRREEGVTNRRCDRRHAGLADCRSARSSRRFRSRCSSRVARATPTEKPGHLPITGTLTCSAEASPSPA